MSESDLFILAGNAGYYNRGSEAIMRGTTHILRHYFENPQFLAISHYKNAQQYSQQCINEADSSIVHKKMHIPYKRFDCLWFTTQVLKRLLPATIKRITYKEIMHSLKDAEAVLALGGDNYSMDYGPKPQTCTDLDDIVVAAGKPLVIWAASVGPFSKNPEYEKYMAKHLQKVHILARESWTVQYLAGLGLVDNVYRVADLLL
jgi:colanic acid/amylovoran biosynthesis protein